MKIRIIELRLIQTLSSIKASVLSEKFIQYNIQFKMKVFVLLTIAICAVAASLTQEEIAQKWATFKTTHNKVYKNHLEEVFRKQMFMKNLQHIEEHNARYNEGLETYKMGINKFTDFTKEELRAYSHGFNMSQIEHNPLHKTTNAFTVPSSLDWRDKGVVTAVKNQGSCGSCWAFATTGALEAQVGIHSGMKVTLSEQQLVDCSEENNGCLGGWAYKSYDYIIENGGINYDTDYPYEAIDNTCRYDPNNPKVTIRDYSYRTGLTETDLKDLVATEGPVTTAIHVVDDFYGYQDGVFYSDNCPKFSSNHVVVIVGYGNENGQDYWLVKNSWGEDWGLSGYVKMARNRDNNCGIASYIAYPLL